MDAFFIRAIELISLNWLGKIVFAD